MVGSDQERWRCRHSLRAVVLSRTVLTSALEAALSLSWSATSLAVAFWYGRGEADEKCAPPCCERPASAGGGGDILAHRTDISVSKEAVGTKSDRHRAVLVPCLLEHFARHEAAETSKPLVLWRDVIFPPRCLSHRPIYPGLRFEVFAVSEQVLSNNTAQTVGTNE